MKIKLFLVFMLLLQISLFGAEQAKEFGPSITFAEDGPNIKLSDLKGKVVVIVFFQSWCPKCNKWSGEKFKKVDEAFGKDKSIVLIALKTDGGGISGAKAYLKERLNTENWIVGVDKNAEYYTDINGKDDLFHYAVINGKGEVVEKSYFGSDALSKKNFKDGYFAKSFLPKEPKYSDKLSKAVMEAEVGSYKAALIDCRSFVNDKLIAEEAKTLEKNIYGALQDKINDLAKLIRDTNEPNRFAAFLDLRHLAEALQGIKIQNEAVIVISEVKNDPFFKKELNAEIGYLNYQKNLALIKKSEISKYKETFLPKFFEMYKDTYFANIIQKEEEKK